MDQQRTAVSRWPTPVLNVLAAVNDRPGPRLAHGQYTYFVGRHRQVWPRRSCVEYLAVAVFVPVRRLRLLHQREAAQAQFEVVNAAAHRPAAIALTRREVAVLRPSSGLHKIEHSKSTVAAPALTNSRRTRRANATRRSPFGTATRMNRVTIRNARIVSNSTISFTSFGLTGAGPRLIRGIFGRWYSRPLARSRLVSGELRRVGASPSWRLRIHLA